MNSKGVPILADPAVSVPWLKPLLIVLSVAYLLQLTTPLRVNTDSLRLLAMASSAADGNGFLVAGAKDRFPVGYPAVIVLFENLGIARSSTFVALNLAAMAVGLFACFRLLRSCFEFSENRALLGCLLTAGSWVMVKHATIAITDHVYFGLSTLTVFVLWRVETENRPGRRMLLWCVGLALAGACLMTRTIAITLVAALVVAMLPLFAKEPTARRFGLPRVLVAAVLTVPIVYLIFQTAYFQDFTSKFFHDAPGMLVQAAGYRSRELGEIATNLPANRLGSLGFAFCIIGAVVFGLMLTGAAKRWGRWGSCEVYLFANIGVLLLWPYYDPRFWVPIIPFVFALCAIGFDSHARRFPVWARRGYLAVFGAGTAAAVGYSTMISFSGEAFPTKFSNGDQAELYFAARRPGDPTIDRIPLNPDLTENQSRRLDLEGVKAIRRFEPRWRPETTESP